jgi:hypothetical protein
VLRFGGETLLTKHDQVETGLKCPLSIGETTSSSLNVNDLVAENIAQLYASPIFAEDVPRLKSVRVKKARAIKSGSLGRSLRKLYNLESGNEKDKPLHIELDLYQMETY